LLDGNEASLDEALEPMFWLVYSTERPDKLIAVTDWVVPDY
jgi:hypothetical protein